MDLFCVTARTCSPNRVRCSRNQTAKATTTTKATTATRVQGSTKPWAISTPPASQSGLATDTFWAPKTRRTVWMRPRLIPQVASSVSRGRP
jgi:hypothetical protein